MTKKNGDICEGRVYGYVRVSTDEQVDKGLSLRVQRARIRAYAKAKNLKLIDIFADEGISGSPLDREGVEKLVEKVGTEEKIKTKRGGKWYASTVKGVLEHPIHKKLRK